MIPRISLGFLLGFLPGIMAGRFMTPVVSSLVGVSVVIVVAVGLFMYWLATDDGY